MERGGRLAYFDRIKGILIVLVVVAHMVINYRFEDSVKELFDVIVMVVMPAFCYLSGYFSKSDTASTKKNIIRLLVLYGFFNCLYILWFGIANDYYQLTEPYYVHWYLLAVLVWRLVTSRLRPRPWTLPLFFAIALIMGFWTDVGNDFALARIVCYFPFFLSGWLTPPGLLEKGEKKWGLVLLGLALLAFVVSCSVLISNISISRSWLTWHYMMNYYTMPGHLLLRLEVFVLAAGFIVGLLLAVPKGGRGWGLVERWGRNSLWIYLFHRPVTLVFASLFGEYDQSFYPIALGLALLTVLVYGSDRFSGWMNKALAYVLNTLCDEAYADSKRKKAVTAASWSLIILTLLCPILGYLR